MSTWHMARGGGHALAPTEHPPCRSSAAGNRCGVGCVFSRHEGVAGSSLLVINCSTACQLSHHACQLPGCVEQPPAPAAAPCSAGTGCTGSPPPSPGAPSSTASNRRVSALARAAEEGGSSERSRPAPRRLTCPPLVTTDRYQRHLTLNRLSVCPSAGTSSAECAARKAAMSERLWARSGAGSGPRRQQQRRKSLQLACRHGGAVCAPTEHIGLKGNSGDWRLRLQPRTQDMNRSRHLSKCPSGLPRP